MSPQKDLKKMSIEEIGKLVEALSPDQLATLKRVVPGANGDGSFAELPDGSIKVSVIVPSDIAPALKEWASAADETLEVFLKHFANEAMMAYFQMDWQSVAPVEAPKGSGQ